MIGKTAWKNVWRNKTRSLVVIVAITIGIFAGVYSVALMNGMISQRVDAALNTEIGHIQIDHKKFRENNDIQYILSNTEEIIEQLQGIEGIEAISRRTILTGMANSASKSTGVQIIGINPEEEKKVLSLYENVLPETGTYFEGKNKTNVALVGESLAKELNLIVYQVDGSVIDTMKKQGVPNNVIAKLDPFLDVRFKNEKLFFKEIKAVLSNDEQDEYGKIIVEASRSFRGRTKIVLTFLDKNNIQTGASFRIAGLFNLNNNMFEKSQLFVLNSDIKPLAGLAEDEYHQLVVRINNIENTSQITNKVKSKLNEYDVMSWKEIQPELAMSTDLVTQFYLIFMIVILAALAFGIVNTMLMVVLERTKELGMLTAIGMNKKRVFSMIMLESVFLSLIGGIVGMIVGKVLIDLTAHSGINLSMYAEGFEEMGYAAIIYPEINNQFFILVTTMIIITGIISAIYPAYKALKLNPADALRTE